jgi:high-affinity Fe2+/Pb2+ permease
MLHTLIGYSAAPDGAQLIVYLGTIAAIVGLMRLERSRNPRAKLIAKPA